MNQHIKQYLEYFLSLPVPPHYAVMITGDWGSGKTHLVKNICEEIGNRDDLKIYYVSLYGLCSTSQIDDLIFACLHPILANKTIKAGTNILMSALKVTTNIGFDLNGGGNKETEGSLSIPKIDLSSFISDDGRKSKSIFIFDDFERCSIKSEDVLGYINYYVEHLGTKVLVISNSEKIESDKFANLKEKVIGLELKVIAEFDSAFDAFILELFKEDECKNAVSSNKDIIKKLFNEAKYNNLRMLRSSFLQFSRFYRNLPEKAKLKSEFISDLLEVFLPLSFEFSQGADFSLLNYVALIDERNKPLIEKFNKYTQFEIYQVVNRQSDLWKYFFVQGIVDSNLLETYVDSHHLFETDNIPHWVKLWNWRYLTSEQFESVKNNIKKQMDNKEITEAGEILHIFGIQMMLVSSGFAFETIEAIFDKGKNYIDSVRDEISFNVFAEEHIGMRSYAGFGYPSDIEQFDQLFKYSKQLSEKQIQNSYPEKAKKLLERLKEKNITGLYELFDYSGIFGKFPVFKYLDPNDVMAILSGYETCDSWHTFNLCLEQRKERLKSYQYSIDDELDFYRSLKSLVEEYIDNSKATSITSIGAKMLSNRLENIINPDQSTE